MGSTVATATGGAMTGAGAGSGTGTGGGNAANRRLPSSRTSGSTKRGLADRLGTAARAANSPSGSSSGTPIARRTGSVRKTVAREGGPDRAAITTENEIAISSAAATLRHLSARRARRPNRRAMRGRSGILDPRGPSKPTNADPPPERAHFRAY